MVFAYVSWLHRLAAWPLASLSVGLSDEGKCVASYIWGSWEGDQFNPYLGLLGRATRLTPN
jgi:hypothetical protein